MSAHQAGTLHGYRVVIQAPIAWGDMDAFGHVNNTVFFRLFESARMAYLDRVHFSGADSDLGPILASTHCRFRRAIIYPDVVSVGARVTEVKDDRFTMEYCIVRQDGEIAGQGGGVVVAYDYGTGTKISLPAEVREAIRGLDAV